MIFGKPNFSVELFPEEDVLAGHARGIKRALDQNKQMFHIEGFGQKIIGALFHRLDRGLDRSKRGHHDHRQERVVRFHCLQHLETVLLRQLEVRKHQADPFIGKFPDPFGPVLGRDHPVAFGFQGLLEHFEHALFVFYDEDRISHAIVTSAGGSL